MRKLLLLTAMVSLAACETVNTPVTASPEPVAVIAPEKAPAQSVADAGRPEPTVLSAPEVSDADTRLLRVKSEALRLEADELAVQLAEMKTASETLNAETDAQALEASQSEINATEAKVNALYERSASLQAEADAAAAELAAYEADLEAEALRDETRVAIASVDETKITPAETSADLEAAKAAASAADIAKLAEAEARSTAARAEADAAILAAKAARLEAQLAIEKANAAAVKANAAIQLASTGATTPVPAVSMLDYSGSALIRSLVSDNLKNDDVAIMGIISGARKYCGLNWEPGFVGFIDIANSQRMDLQTIASDHGFFLGSATKSLRAADYKCVDEDLVSLRAINPY